MKIIDSKTHGYLDYIMGILLIMLPFLVDSGTQEPESIVLFVLGAAMLLLSLATNYELGAIRVIPMSVHLTMDVLSGILLAGSPWLFGFADRVFLPHLVLGLLEIGAGLMTRQYSRK